MASLHLGSQQQPCPSVFRPVERPTTAQNRGAPTVSNADGDPTPLSAEETFVQVDFLRAEASGQTEFICRLKAKSATEHTTSPERLQVTVRHLPQDTLAGRSTSCNTLCEHEQNSGACPRTGIMIPSEDSSTLSDSLTSDDSSQSSVSLPRDIEIRHAEQGSTNNRLKRKRSLSSDNFDEHAQLSQSDIEPAEKKSKDEVILDLQEEVRFLRYLNRHNDQQAVDNQNQMQQALDELQEQISCSICYTNTVDIVASWCGHAFCESCIFNEVDATWERQCAKCKTQAGKKKYIPLYLS